MEQLLHQIEVLQRSFEEKVTGALKVKSLAITKEQWKILMCISDNEPINQKDVAKLTLKDPAALTRMLDLLEKKSLVERIANNKDRRSFELKLKVEGARLVRRFKPIYLTLIKDFSKPLKKSQLKEVNSIISLLITKTD